MSELISIRELARRLDVTDTTIRRAIKKGRIFGSAIVGSKLDFDLASKQFKANCDTAKKRKSQKKFATPPIPVKKLNTKSKAELKGVIISEEEFGEAFKEFETTEQDERAKTKKHSYAAESDDPENELTIQRTRKEKAMADMAELKVLEYEGSLVDVEKATLAVFEVMREERDHWLRFPDRIAAKMAARFGIDKVEYKTALTEEVKSHCKDVGELNFDLAKD